MIHSFYEAPQIEILEASSNEVFLASVEGVRIVNGGTWSDEDEG